MKNSAFKIVNAQTQKSQVKHLVTGEELSVFEIKQLLAMAITLKKERIERRLRQELAGLHLALLFDKPSLRTRFSFSVAMRELGGDIIESTENTRKTELPEDQALVLSGYCHAMMLRTHSDSKIARMAKVSQIPMINGLSDLHHPCQILSDLLTLFESFNTLSGLTLSYVGDGNNILHSLLLMAPQMGINIHYCCPEGRAPNAEILNRALKRISNFSGKIQVFKTPRLAVSKANVVYTDVWSSMGFENQSADELFDGYQINENLMKNAAQNAIFMHCLPMERGKEVSISLPDQPCSVIFRQSENRLHLQKALLLYLLKGE